MANIEIYQKSMKLSDNFENEEYIMIERNVHTTF